MGISVEPKRIGKVAKRLFNKVFRASWQGAIRGAFLAKKHLVTLSPTDRGDLRRSWSVKKRKVPGRVKGGRPAILINDAPHAGIIEGGARPHKVGREGVESIAGWVARKRRRAKGKKRSAHRPRKSKGARGDVNARKKTKGKRFNRSDLNIAWAIAKKIEKEGQKPTFFVRKELTKISEIASAETSRRLRQVAAKPPR